MYECHITIDYIHKDRKDLQVLVESHEWKFSAIDGDPVLGNGVKCYATKHFAFKTSIVDVILDMKCIAQYIKGLGYNVCREKVEVIIYDTKVHR